MKTNSGITRRTFVGETLALTACLKTLGLGASMQQTGLATLDRRPPADQRKFRSAVIESYLRETSARIADPHLRAMFSNCFPNTLDTTVFPGEYDGKPDTAVVTGDIAAMWLRDSSAQVWPYLRFASRDVALRRLLAGVIRRQTRCLLIDPYANAFMVDLSQPPLEWSRQDETELKPGVAERKYELDSLCYPIRLAHGYWKATGDQEVFDDAWRHAMHTVVATMRVQQRRNGEGPYRFRRKAQNPTDSLVNGLGNPANPVGLIASCFRPSDDACVLPFLVPSNLFAVTCLQQLAEMATVILRDGVLAAEARALGEEVAGALRKYAVVPTPRGTVWAYEVDGFGGQVLMDDANVPSLLALPYLESSPDPALYARTRQLVWSSANPWFFRGAAGEGIGGPHLGRDSVWPMSQIIFALTSQSAEEVRRMLNMLRDGSAGTGFVHESYSKDDAGRFTRAWFAWANTLFGEMVGRAVVQWPSLFQA